MKITSIKIGSEGKVSIRVEMEITYDDFQKIIFEKLNDVFAKNKIDEKIPEVMTSKSDTQESDIIESKSGRPSVDRKRIKDRIMKFLGKIDEADNSQIVNHIGNSRNTVEPLILELEEEGMIFEKRRAETGAKKWRITKPDETEDDIDEYERKDEPTEDDDMDTGDED